MSASTAEPSTSPVEALTPDAMSVATTGASAPFMASIAATAGPRGAPAKPVPKTASITTPGPRSASVSAPGSRSRAPSNRSTFALASSESSSGGPSTSASTSNPVSRRARAATSPSPPLFPLPQTIAALLVFAACAAASATARPAVSISSSDGTPCSEIAQPSVARISSASRHGSSQSSIGVSLLWDKVPAVHGGTTPTPGFAGAHDCGIARDALAGDRGSRRDHLALQARCKPESVLRQPADNGHRSGRPEPRREPAERAKAQDRLLLRLSDGQRRQGHELRPLHRPRGDLDRPVPGVALLAALPGLRPDVSPAHVAGPRQHTASRVAPDRVRRRQGRLEGVSPSLQPRPRSGPDRALA